MISSLMWPDMAIDDRSLNPRATRMRNDEFFFRAHADSGGPGFPVSLLVIDADFRVVSSPFERDTDDLAEGVPLPDLYDRATRVMRPRLHPALRNLWEVTRARGIPRQMVIPPLFAISLMPLEHIGEAELAVLTVEAVRSRANLHAAVAEFALTPRETQILALILDGTSGPQMATMLDLAESTVQTYFKKLLEKTRSANRYGMVAKILGWQKPPGEPVLGNGRITPIAL